MLQYFLRKKETLSQVDLEISTQATSPAGAGLGGSSTLSVSLLGAIKSWADGRQMNPALEADLLIDIVRDIETDVIQVPAGLQDYYGAVYGGLQSLKWNIARHERKYFNPDIFAGLQERILLFYSGQSRNSGINNWVLFKKLIDQDSSVQKKFQKICDSTLLLENALKNKNWEEVGHTIQQEWKTRKTLAKGISTPKIDQAFEFVYKKFRSYGKVCGAGGGGCFFIYFPHSDTQTRNQQKAETVSAFIKKGIQPLPFQATPQGLEIQVTHA